MKYVLEEASLNYIKELLEDDKYYIEQLEDSYVNLKACVNERNNLQQENQQLKEIIEKAKEYIEKFIPIDEDTILMRKTQRNYLLDILNGDDK